MNSISILCIVQYGQPLSLHSRIHDAKEKISYVANFASHNSDSGSLYNTL